jgi:hypothetical protein
MMVVAFQWMNAEEREAARHDRQLDRQLDAAVPT